MIAGTSTVILGEIMANNLSHFLMDADIFLPGWSESSYHQSDDV